ncbi:phage tail protein [Novispirillum itersonii]|uniref:phage tail protein n=1 Tax=Novispirillum itersonii TaxID=189 RepID=UPI00037662D6|nr:tail fiber protein [Novispirillum itersonii]
MSTPFIGQICYFSFPWTPEGWLPCDSTTYNIQHYPALYSLIGTVYGGDAKTTFKVPDLRGRVPVGLGLASAPGSVLNWTLGSVHGMDAVILSNTGYLPSHNHTVSFAGTTSTTGTPVANAMLSNIAPAQFWATNTAANTTLHPATLGAAYSTSGGVAAHENRQPFVVLNPCIAWDGEYPDLNS